MIFIFLGAYFKNEWYLQRVNVILCCKKMLPCALEWQKEGKCPSVLEKFHRLQTSSGMSAFGRVWPHCWVWACPVLEHHLLSSTMLQVKWRRIRKWPGSGWRWIIIKAAFPAAVVLLELLCLDILLDNSSKQEGRLRELMFIWHILWAGYHGWPLGS